MPVVIQTTADLMDKGTMQMAGTERPRTAEPAGDDLRSHREINRRVVLAAAGLGIAAGAASLVACDKHGSPSASSPSPTPSTSPTPATRQAGELDLAIPRSAFGNGQGTYTVFLCADTLISNVAFDAVPGQHKLPQPIVFDGGQHVLIVRPSTGGEWTHPVQLPTVDRYEVDSISVTIPDEGGEKQASAFGFEVDPSTEKTAHVPGGVALCSVRG